MSAFANPANIVQSSVFEFGDILPGGINRISCKDGSVAGFALIPLAVFGSTFNAVEIYDVSSGAPVAKGIITSVVGLDLLGGLFATGILPDRDFTDPACIFYRVDY